MAINAGTVVAYMQLDTSRFKSGLANASAQLKDAGTQFKNALSFDPNVALTDRFKSAGESVNQLGKSVTSVGKSMTTGLTLPILGAGTACIKMASDFETGMAKISTISDNSKVSLRELGDGIKKLSTDTGQDTKNIQEAVYEAISSGVSTENSLEFTGVAAKAAIGGFTDTQTAVDGLTTTLNAFNIESNKVNTEKLVNQMMVAQNLGKTTFGDMSKFVGNIAATANAAGISTKELFSSLGVLTANGIKTSEAVTGMKAAISNIVNPSEKATKAADALGLTFNVAEMKAKGWMPFLDEVRDKLKNSAPEYLKAADNVSALEKKIADATSGKKADSEQFKKAIEEEKKVIEELDKKKSSAQNSVEKKKVEEEIKIHKEKIKTLQQEAKEAKKGYSPEQIAQWKKELKDAKAEQKALQGASKDTLMGFATMFGSVEGLNSVLALTSDSGGKLYKESMNQMDSGTDYMNKSFDKMMDTPKMRMEKAIASLKVAGMEIGGAFLPFVAQLATGLSLLAKGFMTLPKPMRDMIGYSLAMVACAGPLLMVGGKMVSGCSILFRGLSLLTGGMGKSTKAMGSFGTAFSKLGKLVSSGGKGVLKAFKLLGKGIGTGAKLITKGFKAVMKAGKAFKLAMLLNPEVLATVAVLALVVGAGYLIIKNWDKIKKKATELGSHIKASFSDTDTLVGKIVAGWGAIFEKTGGVIEKCILGWKAMFSAFGDFLSKVAQGWKAIFKSLGEHIMDGLNNGIKGKLEGVKKVIKSAGEAVKDTFKSVMGIHSPSRVFAEYGGFIGEGLIQGMQKMEGKLSNQTNKYANAVMAITKDKPRIDKTTIKAPNEEELGHQKGGATTLLKQFISKKTLDFNPEIKLFVTVKDTGKEGAEKLGNEVQSMTENALKSAMVSLFMDDAVRD